MLQRDLETTKGRFVCSPATPWRKGLPTPVVHPAGREIRGQSEGYPGGDIFTMRCDVCSTEWKTELAQ